MNKLGRLNDRLEQANEDIDCLKRLLSHANDRSLDIQQELCELTSVCPNCHNTHWPHCSGYAFNRTHFVEGDVVCVRGGYPSGRRYVLTDFNHPTFVKLKVEGGGTPEEDADLEGRLFRKGIIVSPEVYNEE